MASTPFPELHFLFFPFLTRSHMIPLMSIATAVAARGVKTTVVTTRGNAHLLQPTIDRYASSADLPMDLLLIDFNGDRFGLHDGCESLTSVPPELMSNFFAAVHSLKAQFGELIGSHAPDCAVYDALYPWMSQLTRERRLPGVVFQWSGLFSLCAVHELSVHKTYESVEGPNDSFLVPSLPHRLELTRATLPELFLSSVVVDTVLEAEKDCYGFLVNSFRELEPQYAEHYAGVMGEGKVYCVGPVSQLPSSIVPLHPDGGGSSVGRRRHECLSWLDSRKPNSVLYVSFGTLSRSAAAQLREVALGLEKSNHSFLWAVRTDDYDWLPEGFEERTEGRGLLVKSWAPQFEILNHENIGGFVTHCGWNSTMESVTAGVPMITWPLQTEQFINEALVVDVLELGAMVWDGFKTRLWEEKVVVKAEVVAEVVDRVMGEGDWAAEVRRRARDYADKARKAVGVGGSSCEDLNRWIIDISKNRQAKESTVTPPI